MGDSAAKITKPAETRSNKGCWTCRLRKKKCDEHRPGCLRCASAGIECNFGSKPDWFGDEAKSRRKLAHIKLLVKGSAARKRAVTVAAKHESAVAVSPVEQSHAGEAAGTSPRRSIGKLALQDSTTAASSSRAWLWPQLVDNQEADLIMHYLDFVFFIQFRFYQPSIARGGRGWLLTLLTYTKPLYHAALSLSAFHQQSLLCHERRQPQDHIRILDELKHHHELTLKELQLFIQAHNEEGESSAIFEGCIQILACMVELISFELFHGGANVWQIHLRAATDLVLRLHSTWAEEAQKRSAVDFLTGAIVWFDILACISTASHPHLAGETRRLLGHNDRIRLDTIMGCQNWVMVIISEIAQLSAIINTAGYCDTPAMLDSKADIKARLEAGKSSLSHQISAIHRQCSGPPLMSSQSTFEQYVILIITNIFASAAIIYLHTSTLDIHPRIDVATALSSTIAAFNLLPDRRMTRGLVWPLCIAGCMAESFSEQVIFKDIVSAAMSDSGSFGNSSTVSEILEKAWEMQRMGDTAVNCASAIRELGTFVLLV